MKWLVGVVAVGVLAASSAEAAPPEIFPLAKVRRGQKGYGLTTMKGTTPERFEFEVIGINRNFLPKMDIILVKSDDPKLAITGFWAGMSGSPLFIEGKLTCAFSYGFRFNKVAIGGCTPIHYMKREGFIQRRLTSSQTMGRPVRAAAREASKSAPQTRRASRSSRRLASSWREWRQMTPSGDINEVMTRLAPRSDSRPWIFSAPLPPRPRIASGSEDDRGMVAASVPLAMSGFSKTAFAQAKQLFAEFPVEPMAAGGTGNSNSGPDKFALGGSISVQFMRGDMSLAGTGTVSYVEDSRVLAFGHPMFQTGETYAPVATAEVHTVIPSALQAFVVASPLREVGSLVQDRQSTIMADTELRSDMIPMKIKITSGQNGAKRTDRFNVEMLRNRFFTPTLASIAASSAASSMHPDRDHVTAKMTSRVKVTGYPAITFTDYLYSSGGASDLVGSARGLRVLVPLLHNPFAPIEIESVELDVVMSFDSNFGEITAIRLPTAELAPGKKSYVDVTLTRYGEKDVVERIPFDVPQDLAGSLVRVSVTSGDSARIDAAPPQSVADLMKVFGNLLPGNVFAVTLYTADEGFALDGKLVRDLPSSAVDKLKTETRTDITSSYKAMSRSIMKSTRVITGSQAMLIKVAAKRK